MGVERTFPKKTLVFQNCRSYIDYIQFLRTLVPFAKRAFIHHEVMHKQSLTQKVVFDIDINDGSTQLYQEVIDKLIYHLLISIFPDLDLTSEIIVFTSHGDSKYSVHVILQRLVHRDPGDLAYLYQLVKEAMLDLFQNLFCRSCTPELQP